MFALKALKPGALKALVSTLLFLIVIGGQIQSWSFTDQTAPPPVLYELLRPVPIWPVAVLLLAPLLVASAPLLSAGIDLTALDTWYGILAVAVYLYVLGSLLVELLQALRKRRTA